MYSKTAGKKAGSVSQPDNKQNTCSNSLPKNRILRNQRDFREVFSTGRRIKGTLGQIIVKPWPEPKAGFIVGRRVGNAVTRNRLRRYMKEFYRTHKHLIPEDRALIFQLFSRDLLPDYHRVESEFLQLCQKL